MSAFIVLSLHLQADLVSPDRQQERQGERQRSHQAPIDHEQPSSSASTCTLAGRGRGKLKSSSASPKPRTPAQSADRPESGASDRASRRADHRGWPAPQLVQELGSRASRDTPLHLATQRRIVRPPDPTRRGGSWSDGRSTSVGLTWGRLASLLPEATGTNQPRQLSTKSRSGQPPQLRHSRRPLQPVRATSSGSPPARRAYHSAPGAPSPPRAP